MLDVRVVDSLAGVDRTDWATLFPGEIEDYDYLTAIERSGLSGFRWRYVLASEGGELVAAAPAFLTDYPLETTLTGAGRRVADAVRRAFPGLLTLRLGCIGSPCTEKALVGVSPSVTPERRAAVVKALVTGFEAAARREGCSLIGLKDVLDEDPFGLGAGALGYRAVASLPIAHLDIDFPDLDRYCERLSASARKDMRRKLRALDRVRIEVRTQVDDVIDRIMALYAETRDRAEMSLEELTPEYFQGVLREMPGRALFVLYFDGDQLLAANLLLHDDATLLDKYFCMDAVRGRAFNLYFLSWFTNIRLCLEAGRTRYQAGQAAYGAKVRLGSQLTRTTNFFRHRNPILNALLGLAAPLFAADASAGTAA
ncbi:GNAT family N-acetyltransferase [Phenylobacterium sp.]|uniref:GNAT family N-acetyltransferase n=1 Tax=Phenylobacterium sp. TaxID=1871053 RepID=UPI0025F17619|nr:GNAT family N-acetyltransferase [Phenylobacterium sp.]